MDVVPFLKELLWLFSVRLRAPGEIPRSSDRAAATLSCKDLIEDATLEHIVCGSTKVVRRSFSASALDLCSICFKKSCSFLSTLVVMPAMV
jgi:hypothetical protein